MAAGGGGVRHSDSRCAGSRTATVGGSRRAGRAMLRPSQCPASSGGWHRREPRPRCSGLPGDGQGQPSVHGERVGGQGAAPSQIRGSWPLARGWGGVVLSVMPWLRLGIQITVEGPAGQVGIYPSPSGYGTALSDPQSPWKVLTRHTKGRGGSPALVNCQLPPRSGDTHPRKQQLDAGPPAELSHGSQLVKCPHRETPQDASYPNWMFLQSLKGGSPGGLWPEARASCQHRGHRPSWTALEGWLAPAVGPRY